jgi:hypothetical protein
MLVLAVVLGIGVVWGVAARAAVGQGLAARTGAMSQRYTPHQ